MQVPKFSETQEKGKRNTHMHAHTHTSKGLSRRHVAGVFHSEDTVLLAVT